jgi:hypothetical protein
VERREEKRRGKECSRMKRREEKRREEKRREEKRRGERHYIPQEKCPALLW